MHIFNCLRPITRATTILRTAKELKIPGKQVFLTFDDGPESVDDNTNRLLDVLDHLSVKACFCAIGQQVEKNPDVFKRIYDDGHLIVNHFYSHRISALWSTGTIRTEIEKCDHAMAQVLDVPAYRSVVMRPPGGMVSPALWTVLKEDDFQMMYITQYAYDTRRSSPRVVKSILKDARQNQGGIYVMHDGLYTLGGRHRPHAKRDWVPNAVKQIVQTLRQEDFEFAAPQILMRPLNG